MMISAFPRAVLALTLGVGVAGCEMAAEMDGPPASDGPTVRNVFGYNELTLAAGGYNPGEPPAPPASVKNRPDFPNPQAFVNVLSRIVGPCPNVRACSRLLRASNKSYGLAGTSSAFFSRVGTRFEDTGNKPDYEVTGQITETCPNDPSQPGYQYDSGANTVRLCVVTRSVLDRGSKAPVYRFYDVSASNVGVAPRVGNRFPEAANATGLDVHVGANSLFQHKLYAAGRDIQVTAHWVTLHTDATTGKPDWSQGAKFDPSSGLPIFQPNPDSCIDMLFEEVPPPTLPSDYEPGVKYCLGRCATPPIVNTM